VRVLGLTAALAIATATPAAALPQPPATPDKLDQLATILEGMHGGSRIVDQRIADLLRAPAAGEGVVIPLTASAYTELPASAEKLRPKSWLISIGELNNGWVTATLDKWSADGMLATTHEKGGRNDCQCGDAAGGLALSAAMLRAWAQEMRESAPAQ
jgi:hypothetical protein